MDTIIKYLRLLLLITLSAYTGADIGFFAAHKLPVVDDFFYSRQFPIRGSNVDNIIIVGIDNNTMERFGILRYKRSVYAEVLAKILEGGPKAIAVDIFFDGVRDIKDDLRLIKTLNSANGNIVLAIYVNEAEKFLLNHDNITSKEYFNGNELISLGSVYGVVKKSSYGGITKLLLTPQFDKEGREYYPLPIVALTKYLNADFDAYPYGYEDNATIGGISIPTFTDKYLDRYMYINYTGGPEAFNLVAFEKVPQMNPEVFKDKIVLIGTVGDSMSDNHQTPISKTTPGIVIHANIIHTIINKRFISPMGRDYQWLFVFIVMIAAFILFYYAKNKISIPTALVILVIVKLTIDLMFTHYGIYVQFFPFIVSTWFVSTCAIIFRKSNNC
ncbi:CHASE2 domain-containing protein [Candidatus Magnetominusculus dajiuhuensis]|uniref:CHASE2 domain-containing protein n=1 Tax=Candidatus Magnetominusculus dajiuhuensis TaxID=3137712 RepID=UPI003B436356